MAKVVIVQPYVPTYRAPLFDQLASRLREDGHELLVLSGQPAGTQHERHDAAVLAGAHHETFVSRVTRVGPVTIRRSPSIRRWGDADVLVVELAAGSAVSYRALLRRTPTAVWGHVGSYVARDRLLLRLLRTWQVRHADKVLAYTDNGGATAVGYGADPSRVAVLRNTVETRTLRSLVLAARERSEPEVRAALGVGDGPLFAVIGGLDESKRIDLLAAALDLLWRDGSRVQFLIGGRGHMEYLLEPARLRGQVVILGHVDDRKKALMARVAIAICNPGRVGLIAVESFSLGLPIVTTENQLHAPEFEYLRPGQDSLLVPETPEALAATLSGLADGGADELRCAAESRAEEYPLNHMVDRMYDALIDLLPTHVRAGSPRPKSDR